MATVTNVSNTSYVEGPVRKIGNAPCTLPVGEWKNVHRPHVGRRRLHHQQSNTPRSTSQTDSIYPVE
ncbi:MAG: hypothetical protein IPN36_12660 [Bacteroidetes bacterium]|nr:hypothetical protein [Bacteroidota bacterium]